MGLPAAVIMFLVTDGMPVPLRAQHVLPPGDDTPWFECNRLVLPWYGPALLRAPCTPPHSVCRARAGLQPARAQVSQQRWKTCLSGRTSAMQ